jgi:hypothetical protein
VSVIHGLIDLDIPFSELFTYLAMKLGVTLKASQEFEYIQELINKNNLEYNPIALIASVVTLAQKTLNQGR